MSAFKNTILIVACFIVLSCAEEKATLDETIVVGQPILQKLEWNGIEREWRIYVPSAYKKGNETPLVLSFHGTSGTPERQEGLSQFEPLAEKEGFIVVTPAAKFKSLDSGRVTWNVDQHEGELDDVAFIRNLIAELGENYSIDENRIYATGFSGGGRMSSRLACDMSDVFAAIAPVAGVRFPENCNPSRSVPLITFHGKLDPVNHYVHQEDSAPYWRSGVEEALSGWIKHNHCESEPASEKISETLTKLSYTNCDSSVVEFYRSEDTGHTWPGSPSAEALAKFGMGKTDMEISATNLSWEFFKGHPLN